MQIFNTAIPVRPLRIFMYVVCGLQIGFGLAEIIVGAVSGLAVPMVAFILSGLLAMGFAVVGIFGALKAHPGALLFFAMTCVINMMLAISGTLSGMGALMIECNVSQAAFRDCSSLSCASNDSCTKDDLGSGTADASDCKAPAKEFCDARDGVIVFLFIILIVVMIVETPAAYVAMLLRSKVAPNSAKDDHRSHTAMREVEHNHNSQLGNMGGDDEDGLGSYHGNNDGGYSSNPVSSDIRRSNDGGYDERPL